MTYHREITEAGEAAPTSLPRASGRRSLVRTVAFRMVVCTCLGTIVLAAVAFLFLTEQVERRSLAALQTYVAERGRSESELFMRAQRNLARFESRFLALYRDPAVLPSPDFDSYFAERDDGTLRLRERYFTGVRDENGIVRSGISGFIGRRRPPLTDELRRRLVLAYQLVAEFGPGWTGDFANLHASLPENALVIHWPEAPWGLDAAADLDMTAGSVIRSTLQSHNPERSPVWTGLYYDETASDWTVTYQRPIDLDGRHLINPSLDVRLSELIARVVRERPEGGYNMIIARDGTVVAHPRRMDELKQGMGQISVEEFGDPELESIHASLTAAGPPATEDARIVDNERIGAYLGFAELEGPDWWLVTVHPHEIVAANAWEAARLLLLLIAVMFAVLIVTVVLVLRRSVAVPVRQMKHASEVLAGGGYETIAAGKVALPDERRDEIGLLAQSFRTMARRIADANHALERAVVDRTIELELANRKLEELSIRDALTGAYNRRAFDRDLLAHVDAAKCEATSSALILFDIDFFKPYNDNYGHEAGDKALCEVVEAIRRAVPDGRVYRYGGEEIAVILPAADEPHARRRGAGALEAIADLALPHAESPHGFVTASAGLALIAPGTADDAHVLRSADEALYEAKQRGRNRLVSAHPKQLSTRAA